MHGLSEYKHKLVESLKECLDNPTYSADELSFVANSLTVLNTFSDPIENELNHALSYLAYATDPNGKVYTEIAKERLKSAYNLIRLKQRKVHELPKEEVDKLQRNTEFYNVLNERLKHV